MSDLWIEWDCERLDDDGDNVGLWVRIFFEAGGYQPGYAATWDEPGQGETFEDLTFSRAEIDPRYGTFDPLTDLELTDARAYFESEVGQEAAICEALRDRERGPDPDRERERRLDEPAAFDDGVAF